MFIGKKIIKLSLIIIAGAAFLFIVSGTGSASDAFGKVDDKSALFAKTPAAAINAALQAHRQQRQYDYYYQAQSVTVDGNWAYATLFRLNKKTDAHIPSSGSVVLAHLTQNNGWAARLQEDQDSYNQWLDQVPSEFIDTQIKNILRWQSPEFGVSSYSAESLPSGYFLPWPEGVGARVTKNYNSHGTGQIDLVMDVTEIRAAKDGTIMYANDSH
ncbi:MAG: hypothetical protein N2D54_08270, partial [Chloroflexota bacterium]